MSDTRPREQDIRRLYDAFVSGDFEAIQPDLHPEIEFINPAYAVEPGSHVGVTAFIAVLARLHETFAYDRVEIDEVVHRGEGAVVVARFVATGRDSGVPTGGEFAHLLGWKAGRLQSLEWFRDRDEAVAALEGR